VLAGLGGIRHGIGEVQQGNVRPDGLFVESWTKGPIADHIDGEPGLTLVPNMLATGILALAISAAVVVWAAFFLHRHRGGPILSLLSVAMLLVGGGVGPPVIGIVAGWPASITGPRLEAWRSRLSPPLRRALAAAWPPLFAIAAANGVFLFIVSVVLLFAFDFTNADLLFASFLLAIVSLAAATLCAIAYDLDRQPLPVAVR
jgi:hypothetical protein